MPRPLAAIPAALALAAALAPAASAAKAPRDLWATVNVCDTPHSPNKMGVRARMPGNATRERMWMRFTAQYRVSKGKWRPVTGRSHSRWLYAGSALFRNQELGYTFSFDSPAEGDSFLLRGLVQYQWRDKRRHLGRLRTVVVQRTHRYTSAGHATKRAEPAGYSAAVCRIRGPGKPGADKRSGQAHSAAPQAPARASVRAFSAKP